MKKVKMKYIEKIKRTYENRVVIEYEYIDTKSIYIRNIKSSFKREGNGTASLQDFLSEFENYNIYLCATDEHGTEKKILDRWYAKMGFSLCDKVINNICMTHIKQIGK